MVTVAALFLLPTDETAPNSAPPVLEPAQLRTDFSQSAVRLSISYTRCVQSGVVLSVDGVELVALVPSVESIDCLFVDTHEISAEAVGLEPGQSYSFDLSGEIQGDRVESRTSVMLGTAEAFSARPPTITFSGVATNEPATLIIAASGEASLTLAVGSQMVEVMVDEMPRPYDLSELFSGISSGDYRVDVSGDEANLTQTWYVTL